MRSTYEHVTGLRDGVRRAGGLCAQTVVIDVEPLVAGWNGGQEALRRGIGLALDEVAAQPGVRVLCFATNSARRPGAVPSLPGIQVVYLASAGKPLRTAAYRGFPRPGVVIGDQVATDGALAWRLGYAFLLGDWPATGVPAGPRLMAAGGRLLRPLLFTRPG